MCWSKPTTRHKYVYISTCTVPREYPWYPFGTDDSYVQSTGQRSLFKHTPRCATQFYAVFYAVFFLCPPPPRSLAVRVAL